MNFSSPFIRRPIGTALLAIGILLGGVVAYWLLPVASVPNVPIPAIVVFASNPGASPAIMASTVAAPLEHMLAVIPGVENVRSISSTGSAGVVLLFDTGTSIDADAHAVQAAINAALPNLPASMPSRPYYKEFNPASRPVMTIGITSKTMTLGDMYNLADTILDQRLAQVPGVAQVALYGAGAPAVRILLDTEKLAASGLTSTDVYNAVRSANETEPLGVLQGPRSTSFIATNGQLSKASQYREIVLKSASGALLHLSDVAIVIDGEENDQLAAMVNGKQGLIIQITKSTDANVIKTVEAVKALLPELREYLPPAMEFTILNDRTTTIRASVGDIQITLLITILLVLLVVTLFMRRLTPTIAAGITVPLSIAGTAAAMWALGFTLDNFSLLALTICVGFVVDDAIVMIENIVTQHERGLSGIEAALVGAQQIGFTVFSITVSLVVVFLPLTLMGGIVGGLFYEFSMTLSVAIIISGLISLTVTPMICGHFMGRTARLGRDSRAARAIDRGYRASLSFYAHTLDWALAHRFLMLASFVLTVTLTLFFYVQVPKAFLPEEDTGLIMAQTEAPSGVSFDRMDLLQKRVLAIVLANPAVESVSSSIGVSNGFSTANRGTLYIQLRPQSQRVSAQMAVNQLNARLAGLAGINTYLQVAQDLFFDSQSTGGEYSFSVIAPSLEGLASVTQEIENKLHGIRSISDISSDQDSPQTQITVEIDRDSASRHGVSIAAIDGVLQNAFAQQQISRIYEAQNQYTVVLTVPGNMDRSVVDFNQIYVSGNSGPVLLSQIAHYVRTTAPLEVAHLSGEPAATLSFNVRKGYALSVAMAQVKVAIAALALPNAVKVEFGGNAQYFMQSMEEEPVLLATALIAIYIVLGVLYESLLQPLTILSTLPSAGVGALLALLITGTPLSIISIIGIFLLMGIVKKNGIMLVDFALNAEREHNMLPREAIRAACLERFRPIMMTTLAALLGAMPLAFAVGPGEELRRPLGISVIGGLIMCQALTLYTTPVIYLALSGFGKRRARRVASIPIR